MEANQLDENATLQMMNNSLNPVHHNLSWLKTLYDCRVGCNCAWRKIVLKTCSMFVKLMLYFFLYLFFSLSFKGNIKNASWKISHLETIGSKPFSLFYTLDRISQYEVFSLAWTTRALFLYNLYRLKRDNSRLLSCRNNQGESASVWADKGWRRWKIIQDI